MLSQEVVMNRSIILSALLLLTTQLQLSAMQQKTPEETLQIYTSIHRNNLIVKFGNNNIYKLPETKEPQQWIHPLTESLESIQWDETKDYKTKTYILDKKTNNIENIKKKSKYNNVIDILNGQGGQLIISTDGGFVYDNKQPYELLYGYGRIVE